MRWRIETRHGRINSPRLEDHLIRPPASVRRRSPPSPQGEGLSTVGKLARLGMEQTDKEIIELMMES